MRNVTIFSVYQNDQVESHNYLNTVKTRVELSENDIDYLNCVGVYKGNVELSMIVEIDYTDLVEMIASEYKQESILIIESDGRASLKMLSSKEVIYLGVFTEVLVDEAMKNKSYTKIGQKYYICK